MSISLVLPCYNPPAGWQETIGTNYFSFQQQACSPVELIVVLDGPGEHVTPAALTYLQQHIAGIKLITCPQNKGKGHAIRQGVQSATGAIVLYTDVDFPYIIQSLMAVYQPLRDGACDVAVGVKNDGYYAHVPLLRRVISRYLRFLIRLLLSMPITDTQCGLKGFTRQVAPLFLQTTIDRYLFDLEFIRNCFRSGKYRVKAVPVTLNENVHFSSMNYRILIPEMANFIKLLLHKG